MSALTIAPEDRQLVLVKVPAVYSADNIASARTAYGNAAQDIVCNSLGLTPIRINGQFDICFDAKKGDVYYEIKSVRKSGKLVLYDWRMKKESESGVTLFYAILVHSLKNCRQDVLTKMILCSPVILLVNAPELHAIATRYPLHKTTDAKRNGFTREGYRDGYRSVPLKAIKQLNHTVVHPEFQQTQTSIKL